MVTFAVLETIIDKPEYKTLRYTYGAYVLDKGHMIFDSLIASKTLMYSVAKINNLYKKVGRKDGDCIYSSENINIISYRLTFRFWVEII